MKRLAMLIAVALLLTNHSVSAQQESETDQQKLDRMVIAIQQICPISGNKLGENGDPIKVKVGEEELFVCCRGCLEGQISQEHWATIHANFAKAQGICPVMEHEIPEKAKWTIVGGRIFYVCCPPCIEKIEEKPAEYLAKLSALYEKSLSEQRIR